MKQLNSYDIELLLPTEMYNALKDRFNWLRPRDGNGKSITFDEYLERYYATHPLSLLDDYLEWEGIIGYYHTLKEFILSFQPYLK